MENFIILYFFTIALKMNKNSLHEEWCFIMLMHSIKCIIPSSQSVLKQYVFKVNSQHLTSSYKAFPVQWNMVLWWFKKKKNPYRQHFVQSIHSYYQLNSVSHRLSLKIYIHIWVNVLKWFGLTLSFIYDDTSDTSTITSCYWWMSAQMQLRPDVDTGIIFKCQKWAVHQVFRSSH